MYYSVDAPMRTVVRADGGNKVSVTLTKQEMDDLSALIGTSDCLVPAHRIRRLRNRLDEIGLRVLVITVPKRGYTLAYKPGEKFSV